jgi:hypothetical protein
MDWEGSNSNVIEGGKFSAAEGNGKKQKTKKTFIS